MANQDLKIYIDGELVDLQPRFRSPFYINLLIADIENLDKRGGFASNTLSLPATKRNCLIMDRYNDWQKNDSTEFRSQKPVEAYVRGQRVFKGFLFGKETSLKGGKPDIFKTKLGSNNLSWADQMKEIQLNSIDFGIITTNRATIESGFTATYPQHYACPMAHYGGTIGNPCRVKSKAYWRFWINVRLVFEGCFEKAGYTISSKFINSSEFSKMFFYTNYNDWYHIFRELNTFFDLDLNLMQEMVSNDRKALDFVKGVQQLFNLFFFTDEDTKTVFCEPFSDFITGDTSNSIDGKIDYKKKITKAPVKSKEERTSFEYEQGGNDGYRLMQLYFGDVDIFKGGFKPNAEQTKTKDYVNPFFGAMPMFYYPSSTTALQVQSRYIDSTRTIPDPNDNIPPISTIQVPANPFRQAKVYMPYLCDTDNGTFSVERKVFPKTYVENEPFFDFPIYNYLFWLTHLCPYWSGHWGERSAGTSKPVIGVFNGMTPVDPNNYYSAEAAEGDIIRHEGGGVLTFTSNSRPYIYSVDHVLEGSISPNKINLCYSNETQFNQQLQLPSSVETIEGLFSKYYANYIKSIQDSSLYKVPVLWKPSDIKKIDFRNLVEMRNQLFILQKIEKYKPNEDGSTKTHLLKYLINTINANELLNSNNSTLGDWDEIFYYIRGLTPDQLESV